MSEKEKFALKDFLYNREKVTKLAHEIASVYAEFRENEFIEEVMAPFSMMELKERLHHITDMLEKYIGTDFLAARAIILRALPPALDENREDDDFGDFIYAPYGAYVARHGRRALLLPESFSLLEELTKRFSMEFAIRPFFHDFQQETLALMQSFAKSKNYHVRRFASEGSRPRLPWGENIPLSIYATKPLLELLYDDPTSYVRRSVANHLHDISKNNLDFVLTTLDAWKQKTKNTDVFMVLARHALRTHLKKGEKKVLDWFGLGTGEVEKARIELRTKEYSLGDTLEGKVRISIKKTGIFRIGYRVVFPGNSGKMREKVYTLFEGTIDHGETWQKTFRLPLVQRSTRKLFAGKHTISLLIDGKQYDAQEFSLSL